MLGARSALQAELGEIDGEIEVGGEIAEIGEGAKPAATIKRAASAGPVRPYPYPYPYP